MPDLRDRLLPPDPEPEPSDGAHALGNHDERGGDELGAYAPEPEDPAPCPLWRDGPSQPLPFVERLKEAGSSVGEWFRNLPWQRFARWAAFAGAGAGGIVALFILAFFVALAMYTPDISLDQDLYAANRPAAYIFKDGQGRTIGRRGARTGERLALSVMPAYLPAAFLAMEDRRFYRHGGLDYRAILRAAYTDIRAGHYVQGGSTITQQLAKILFLSPKRTISRKLEEMAVARALESRLSKDEILELYLNRIYLGAGAYGVDGAARVYFGKSAKNVTLAEAAMLASLTKAPSAFSPRRDLARARERTRLVLAAMVETGAITREQAAETEAHPATLLARDEGGSENYFFDAAAEEAQRMVGNYAGDLIIVTTMDPAMQRAAHAAVSGALARSGARVRASQGTLVAMEIDGAVRALIGGRSYADSGFNRATHARRQPGSAFKPFVYLTAFEGGLDPNAVRSDEQIDIGGYMPANYRRGTFGGLMTLHHALVRSVNTVAVQLCVEMGPGSVAATASRLGIASPLQPYPSLALGTSEVVPMELVAAYAAFPSGGIRVTPYLVREVRSLDGRVLYRHEPGPAVRVVDAGKAQWMNAILYDVVQSGTGTAARVPGHEVAGKTGTTSDFKDAWFVGYSAELVTGVWIGNDDARPMRHVTGGKLPAQIWATFMQKALKNRRPVVLARSEPAAPVDVLGMDTFGGLAVWPPENLEDWNYYPAVEQTEPETPHREVDLWTENEASPSRPLATPAPRRVRSASQELAPRAVQDDDGEWNRAIARTASVVRVQSAPPQSNPRPARTHLSMNANTRDRVVENPPRRERTRPPPANAAVPPPNTPPPRDLYPMPEDGDYDSFTYE